MMRALWLTSWYPNKFDPWNGDFIQRHARAVSMFCKVDVIHLQRVDNNILTEEIEIEKNISGNLSEEIVFYKIQASSFFKKFNSIFFYKKIFKKRIENYIKENGVPDVVHVHVPMKSGLLALWMKKKYGIEYVVTEHWTIYNNKGIDQYRNKNFLFKLYTKKIFSNAKLFLPVSKNLGELVCKTVTEIPFKTVYNVVDNDYFFYKEKDDESVFTFVHVSTLGEQKNPKAIIDAFILFNKKKPLSKLILVGEKHEHLTSYVASKKINSIEFTGMISYEKVAKILQQSNAFIFFSHYENMPCAVLEALCCGLPVLSSNVGGLSEVLHSDNGILIPSDNFNSLCEAMNQIFFSYKKFKRKNIAHNSGLKFSYENIGKEIYKVYEKFQKNNIAI